MEGKQNKKSNFLIYTAMGCVTFGSSDAADPQTYSSFKVQAEMDTQFGKPQW